MSGYTSHKSFDEVFNKTLNEMPEEKFVVYPDPQFSVEELIRHKLMTENENKIDVSSVKPLGDILEIPKIKEDVTSVPDLVELNQGETEPKELTEEEKRVKFVEALKQSHQRYHTKKAFGVAYKQKRKAKNRSQKKSRKLARKK